MAVLFQQRHSAKFCILGSIGREVIIDPARFVADPDKVKRFLNCPI
jgi:hypothetical protein